MTETLADCYNPGPQCPIPPGAPDPPLAAQPPAEHCRTFDTTGGKPGPWVVVPCHEVVKPQGERMYDLPPNVSVAVCFGIVFLMLVALLVCINRCHRRTNLRYWKVSKRKIAAGIAGVNE